MTGWVVEVHCPDSRREEVGPWLVQHTGAGVEERADGALMSWAADTETLESLQRGIADTFGPGCAVSAVPQTPVDWSVRWRDGLAPRQIGRLLVTPSWHVAATAAPDGPVLIIDPEMAFGSGEHGSTRCALVLLDRHLEPGHRVLDLGSGSGILTIAAALLGARSAIGVDTDPDAIPVAVRNADRNGVTDRVAFVEGDAAPLAPLLGPADLLLSNILRTANTELLPAIRAALRREDSSRSGLALFAGMEAEEADLFRRALQDQAFEVTDEVVDSGWWGVAARPR